MTTTTLAPDTPTTDVLRSRQIRAGIARARARIFKQATDYELLSIEVGERVAGGLLAENLTAAGAPEVVAKRCGAAGWTVV